MIKKRLTAKSINFYKIYAINIVITVVFICLISIVSSVFSSNLILRNMKAFHEEMLEEKQNILDERLRQLDGTLYTIAGEENVFKLLMNSDFYYEKSTVILKIIRYFQNICSNSSFIDGVQLIDVNRGFVITEKTKLPLLEYGSYSQYEAGNVLILSDTEEGQRLEYVKAFFPIRGKQKFFLILTLNEQEFFNNLLIDQTSEKVNSYLLTSDRQILSVSGSNSLPSELADTLQKQTDGILETTVNDQQFVLYKQNSQVTDVALASVQDYTDLVRDADLLKHNLIYLGLGMIAIASIVIYLCSLYVYRPLKQLGYKMQNITGHNPENSNEYSLIEDVITNLQKEKESARPSLIRDSMQKLISEPFDPDRFEYLKRMLAQKMDLEWYALIIADVKNREKTALALNSFRLLIQENTEINGLFSSLSATRITGILNTSLNYKELLRRIENLKNTLEAEHDIPLVCCISRSFQNPENLSLIYTETLRTLERILFTGKETFSYEKDPVTDYKNGFYNKELEKRLIQCVSEGKKEEAQQALGSLTEGLSNEAVNIQYTRFIYFQICSHLIQNVLEMGGRLSREWNEKNIFETAFMSDNIQELSHMAEDIVDACAENFSSREPVYTPNVKKAISFIEEHYIQDLSLEEISSAVFLSSGYLSAIFKEETGYTVLEYITYIRMQKAKDLVLQTPTLKIKDIAEQLGYNNVQSFIRYFKKHYGETPMMFRKNRVS